MLANEAERPPAVLAELLRQHFPGKTIDVRARGWGYLTDTRLEELVTYIARERPDYLILQPSSASVVMPLVEQAIRRRVPVWLHGAVHRWARANQHVERHLLQSRWPWLFRLYHEPLDFLGRCIFGASPTYDVPHVLDFLDHLLTAAKRREEMDVLVLGRTQARPKPTLERRNPNYRQTLAELDSGIVELCKRHGIVRVNLQSDPSLQMLPEESLTMKFEGLHSTAEFKRRWVAIVSDAIGQLEYAYR